MSVQRLMQAVVFLALGVGLIPGCGNDAADDRRPRVVAKGTVLDLARWTTFANPESVQGALLYVPVYSSVFHQTAEREYLLTVTLSIRNIDPAESIAITAVSYFDTEGGAVSEYLHEPVILGPLATRQFVIPEGDRSGGPGANFLVKWESETEVTQPLVEAVMISTSGQQGISFLTHGAVVRELH